MEQVSSEISFLDIHSKALKASPPWQPSSPEQEIRTYGATLTSGQAAFLAILILSDKAEVAA